MVNLQWGTVTDMRRVLLINKPPTAPSASATPATIELDVTFTRRASCQQPDRTFLVGATGENWCVAEEINGQLTSATLKSSESEAKELAQEWRDKETLLVWVGLTGPADALDPVAALGASQASDWAKKNIALSWHAESRRDIMYRDYYVGEATDGWYWASKIGHVLGHPRGPMPSPDEAKRKYQKSIRYGRVADR